MGGYLPYSVALLALLAAYLVLLIFSRRQRRADRLVDLADRARRRRQRLAGATDGNRGRSPNHSVALQRELKKVPTPWGWPGGGVRRENHDHHGSKGGSAAEDDHLLGHWIDYLFATKKTVDREESRLHRNTALRSMVEDRYGQASRPTEMAYRKVIPPRLRDPDEPYDQMDNFPSGRTDTIVNGLSRQSRGQRLGQVGQRGQARPALREVKKPWGW